MNFKKWRLAMFMFLIIFNGCWELGHLGERLILPPTPAEMIGWVNYPEVFPTCITDDLQGNIWIGGEVNGTKGLFRFAGNNWQKIPASVMGISEPVIVSDVYGANNGKLYIGFKDRGFAIYDGTLWKVYNKQSGLVSDSVTVVRVDKNAKIWVGTVSGLTQTDLTTWTIFTTNNGLPDNYILDIEVAEDNLIMCITKRGYARYDSLNWISCSPTNSGSFEFFYEIHSDREGIIWTNHPDTVESYLTFWKFIDKKWQRVVISYWGQCAGNFAFDIYNNLWFSPYVGIVKYSQDSYIVYSSYRIGSSSKEGNSALLNDYIHGIFVDHNNNKWFLTFSGLSSFVLD